jgi:heme exporter protein D
MNWSSAGEFFAMGGYGVYVWGSYGIAAAAMLIDAAYAAARQRRALADARREIDDEREEAAR